MSVGAVVGAVAYRGTRLPVLPTAVVLPMLVGALAFLIVAGTIVMFDPLLILGDDEADIDRRPRVARR
ncbi:hypothetical protein [Streptomyces sp. NPDC013489]|uniref:hypothetical protein n=1 Tax=Streptomyces sp. NPDC013489 TaxID=3155606 RepID=UPI0033FD0C5B